MFQTRTTYPSYCYISLHSILFRKRTVNREPNRSGTGRLRTATNRTANYSYANRMEPNRFHILKKVILSASGGSENDFRELKIKLERGINCNEWIPAQNNLPKCCRSCKWSVLAATTATTAALLLYIILPPLLLASLPVPVRQSPVGTHTCWGTAYERLLFFFLVVLLELVLLLYYYYY